MRATPRIAFCLVLLGIGIGGAAPAAAQSNLYVAVKTDYLPGIDFTAVSLEVCDHPRLRHCESFQHAAFVTQRDEYLEGLTLDRFRVPGHGTYRIVAMLLNSTGNSMARVSRTFDLRVNQVVTTMLIVKPATEATKKGELLEDRDDDGVVSAGDVLRYEVRVREATRFADEPGPGGRLVAGSVVASHGIVTSGNNAGDRRVEVEGLSQADRREDITITFDVQVLPVISNHGTAFVDPIDSVTRERFAMLAAVRTDDPATVALGDPTVTPVRCSLSECAGQLEKCRLEREELEEQIETLFADPDGDGVPAVLDLCPKTEAGTKVDDRGCSQRQFCGRVDAGKVDGEEICRRADWRDDEPLALHPEDCLPKDGLCLVAE